MTSRHVRAVLATVLGSLIASVALAAVAVPAQAADPRGPKVGVAYLDPLKGTLDTPLTAVTSGPCPSGDYFVVRLYGRGLPKDGANINGAMAIVGLPRTPTHQLYVQLSYVLRDFARDNVQGGVMRGTYELAVRCRTALKFASLGDFVGSLTVTGNTFRVIGAAAAPPNATTRQSPAASSLSPSSTTTASAGASTAPSATGKPGAVLPGPSSGTPSPSASASGSTAIPGTANSSVASSSTGGGGHSLLLIGGGLLIALAGLLLLGDRLRSLFRRPPDELPADDPPADIRRPVKKL